MPVLVVKAASIALKAASSLPPQSDRTLTEPPTAAVEGSVLGPVPVLAGGVDAVPLLPGVGVAPPPHALRTSIATTDNVIRRGNLAMWPPPLVTVASVRPTPRSGREPGSVVK